VEIPRIDIINTIKKVVQRGISRCLGIGRPAFSSTRTPDQLNIYDSNWKINKKLESKTNC